MSPTPYRSVRSLLLASVAFAGLPSASVLASVELERVAQREDTQEVLERANQLLVEGQIVRARAMLLALQDAPASATISDQQADQLWSLLAKADTMYQRADRVEMSLQKAQFAFSTDNLIEAKRQAGIVIESRRSDASQINAANAVLDLCEARQSDAMGKIDVAIDRVSDAFAAGEYAQSKLLITRIGQLGLELSDSQQDTLDVYRDKLASIESTQGRLGTYNPAMGMLAPESGMTSDWLTGSTQDGARTGSYLGNQPEDPTPAEPIEVELVEEEPQVDLLDAARRFEAQSLLGQANLAFEERRFNEALTLYSNVLTNFGSYVSEEDLSLARDRRAESQIQLGVQGGPEDDILGDTVRDDSLLLQRSQAAFENYFDQAQQALNEGDTSTARTLIAQADLTIKRARDVMAESAFESFQDRVSEMISQIDATEEQQRIAEREAERIRLAEETAQFAENRRRERDEKIIANLERVHALQQELKYEEALEVVESILFLDPANPAGLLLKDIIQDTLIYRENLGYQRDKSSSYARQSLDNQEAMIATDSIIGYPDDWPAISFRRGDILEYAESEANRGVLANMDTTKMPVEFNDNAFEDVVGFIGSTTGIDIDVDWESLADIGVDPDTPVALKLNSVTINVLLDRVLSKVSDPTLPAGWAVQDGILTIASEEVLRLNTVLETYDIRDLIFVVPDFDNAPEFDLANAIQQTGGGGGGGGSSPFSGGNQDPQDITSREDRVDAIITLIQDNVDPEGWRANGGDTSSVTELNGNFIITSTPKNHRAIIGLLNKLRQQRAVQINVETRFLSVDQNFFEQIGFDLDVYFNADNTEYQLARVIDPSLLPSDYFDSSGNLLDNVTGGGNFAIDTDGDGVPDAFGPVTQPVLGPGFNGGILPDGTILGNDDFSVIRAAQNSFGLTEFLANSSSFAGDILGLNPALGVTGRFLDDIQVDFLVEATQADSRSVIMTAPRLTFTNGQRAFIAVTNQTSFISDLTPVAGSGAGAFDPVVTPISDGVVLDVQGVASADRRYVTLTIQTAQSTVSLDPENNIVIGGAAGGGGGTGGGGGAAPFSAPIQRPEIIGTQISTTVTIPDQGTILLGGQRFVEEVEVESGVPVLSKIPILSRFFSNRIDVKTERTLLILLKPTILIQNEEEELNFPGLLDQLGR
jgi:type II secretory pathway component GspD/PulD (secretin)/tetratricopeptide (TPR) repeat protein